MIALIDWIRRVVRTLDKHFFEDKDRSVYEAISSSVASELVVLVLDGIASAVDLAMNVLVVTVNFIGETSSIFNVIDIADKRLVQFIERVNGRGNRVDICARVGGRSVPDAVNVLIAHGEVMSSSIDWWIDG